VPALLCDAELYRARLEGLGDPLVAPVAETSVSDAARSVLGQAPPRFALAGTSAGGNLAQEMAARVAGARLVVLDACGHLPTLEQPEASARAAREWLSEVE
jgi:thioesterase domain-containing protein